MLHTNTAIILTEQKLLRMQELNSQIEVLKAELDMLKKQTINEYFFADEHYFDDHKAKEYTTARGLVLATYTKSEPELFSQSKFKSAHPKIFEKFLEKKIQYTFRLK